MYKTRKAHNCVLHKNNLTHALLNSIQFNLASFRNRYYQSTVDHKEA